VKQISTVPAPPGPAYLGYRARPLMPDIKLFHG
jgi:hypothetical protein